MNKQVVMEPEKFWILSEDGRCVGLCEATHVTLKPGQTLSEPLSEEFGFRSLIVLDGNKANPRMQ